MFLWLHFNYALFHILYIYNKANVQLLKQQTFDLQRFTVILERKPRGSRLHLSTPSKKMCIDFSGRNQKLKRANLYNMPLFANAESSCPKLFSPWGFRILRKNTNKLYLNPLNNHDFKQKQAIFLLFFAQKRNYSLSF